MGTSYHVYKHQEKHEKVGYADMSLCNIPIILFIVQRYESQLEHAHSSVWDKILELV